VDARQMLPDRTIGARLDAGGDGRLAPWRWQAPARCCQSDTNMSPA
jgi:hypothetical protein